MLTVLWIYICIPEIQANTISLAVAAGLWSEVQVKQWQVQNAVLGGRFAQIKQICAIIICKWMGSNDIKA